MLTSADDELHSENDDSCTELKGFLSKWVSFQ